MRKVFILLGVLMVGIGCQRMEPQNRQEEQDNTPANINHDIRDTEIDSYMQRQGQQGQQRGGTRVK